MVLVAFLRGVNVGGHRTFRPSMLAKQLKAYDVVNIGAAGTFVVKRPGSQAKFRAALTKRLPFETGVAICDGRDLLRIMRENPFGGDASPPGVVRFVSVFSKAASLPALPIVLPPDGDWLVRVIGADGRFVFGEYRRHMRTIGYLSKLDKLFGATATTRNWNTIVSINRVLASG